MFTIITIALIALSFFVHDTIVIKSVTWESAIDVSSITKKDISRDDLMYRQNILNDKLNSEALFIRNSSANICAAGDKIEVSTNSMFKMNFSFWNNRTNKYCNFYGESVSCHRTEKNKSNEKHIKYNN